MTKRKHLTKDECAKRGWFNKSDLKAERLKPAPGQLCAGQYWQGQGLVNVYDKAQCVAMRPYRAPSDKQQAALEAGRDLVGTRKCATEGCTNRIFTDTSARFCYPCDTARRLARTTSKAKEWLQHTPEMVLIDTETTGLGGQDQVVEIAALTTKGRVLMNTLIQPTVPISPDAIAVHGITPELVADAPRFAEVLPQLMAVLMAYPVIIYNAPFDTDLILQSAYPQAEGPRPESSHLQELLNNSRCLMRLYAEFYGEWNDYHGSYTWQTLAAAAEQSGLESTTAHRALADCETSLSLLRHIARH